MKQNESDIVVEGYQEKIAAYVLANGWFQKGLDNWRINAGTVTLGTEKALPELHFAGSSSNQLAQLIHWQAGHIYFLAFEVSVTRYVKGTAGVQVNGRFAGGKTFTFGKRQVTNGFETVTGTFKALEDSSFKVYAGSINRADIDGALRKIILLDLTVLYGAGNEPSANEIDYEASMFQEDGLVLSFKDLFVLLDKKHASTKLPVTDAQAELAFIEEMNKKSRLWKMPGTMFKNTHGLATKGQISTANDILRLTLQAAGSEQITKVWGAKQYVVRIKGKKARAITIRHTVKDAELEAAYDLLGGKSGTLGLVTNHAVVLAQSKNAPQTFVTVVLKSATKTSRYEDTKKLLDVLTQKVAAVAELPDETFTAVAAAGILLAGQPLHWTNLAELPSYGYYGFNETASLPPASLTKMMTALIMLENVANLSETFVIKDTDLLRGSGPKMQAGDEISFWDALYLMMLPSANTIAKAVGRVVGHKIIEARGYM